MTHQEMPHKEQTIHGHTILRWLSDTPMSSERLQERVVRELGHASRFHTCDTENLSLDGLLALLAERQKIIQRDGVWTSDLSKMCSHGE